MIAFSRAVPEDAAAADRHRDVLAGIPSIIYGIWGLFVFAPFLQDTLQPA
jgi:ABC-type phosphate transport system permease subunit